MRISLLAVISSHYFFKMNPSNIQITQLTLREEVSRHDATRGSLAQSLASKEHWKNACLHAQADCRHMRTDLSSIETRCEQLETENRRLNLVINHLVRSPNMLPFTGMEHSPNELRLLSDSLRPEKSSHRIVPLRVQVGPSKCPPRTSAYLRRQTSKQGNH